MCWVAQPPQAPNHGQNGLGSIRACAHDFDEFGALVVGPDPDALAGKGAGNGDAALRHAVAARVEPDDRGLFDRLSHFAPQSGIPWRPRRRAPARA